MRKYILFDNDGVLVETEKWYYEASKRAIKEYFDLELGFSEHMDIMNRGVGVWERAQSLGATSKEVDTARDKRNVYYQEYLQTEDLAIDGVKEILEELSKNYKMGIVTTSRRVDFEMIHKGRGIVDFMDFVLCESDYNLHKPHPEPYLTGLKKFGALPEEAIVVEDSHRGLTSAFRAGIDCVVVHNEFTKTQDFSNAIYKIDTLSKLTKVL